MIRIQPGSQFAKCHHFSAGANTVFCVASVDSRLSSAASRNVNARRNSFPGFIVAPVKETIARPLTVRVFNAIATLARFAVVNVSRHRLGLL